MKGSGDCDILVTMLRYGNRAELRRLFARYPEAAIADWVRRWGRFGLPAPHLAFWKLLLHLEDRPTTKTVTTPPHRVIPYRRGASRRAAQSGW